MTNTEKKGLYENGTSNKASAANDQKKLLKVFAIVRELFLVSYIMITKVIGI